jgi:hypothetical protein
MSINDAVERWMTENYGHPLKLSDEEKDKWFTLAGELMLFLRALESWGYWHNAASMGPGGAQE